MTLVVHVKSRHERQDEDTCGDGGSNVRDLIEPGKTNAASAVPRGDRVQTDALRRWVPDERGFFEIHSQAMFSTQPFHEAYCIAKRRDAADISSG
jgi:hypothetical protein